MPTPDLARRHPYAVFYGDSIVTGRCETSLAHVLRPVLSRILAKDS